MKADLEHKKKKITILSYYFSMDRVLLYSSLLPKLSQDYTVEVLSAAPDEESFASGHPNAQYFRRLDPGNRPPAGFSTPYQFNHYLWDHALKASATREDFWNLRKRHEVATKNAFLNTLAKGLSKLRLHRLFERLLEKFLVRFSRTDAASQAFRAERPDLVIAMCPFGSQQLGYVAAAKRLHIPVMAFITSFDSITTKGRLVYDYDGYFVWSEQMRKELALFFPASLKRPVCISGAPQYDVFFQERFKQSREAFFKQHDLDMDKPLVVYGLGSPNFLDEIHGAVKLVKMIKEEPALSGIQLIIRPHPGFDQKTFTALHEIKTSRQVSVQFAKWSEVPYQNEDAILQWVNTLRHADVVINLSSTFAVDASIVDTPVINLDFDPSPSKSDQELIQAINHRSNHFKPVAESGGLWLVNDYDELRTAILGYLAHAERDAADRKKVVELVAGPTDGHAGERMAEAVAEFLETGA